MATVKPGALAPRPWGMPPSSAATVRGPARRKRASAGGGSLQRRTPLLRWPGGHGASQHGRARALTTAVGAFPRPRGAAAPQRALTISDVARAVSARLRGAA
eukprot:15434158-Alexandrium_andersonii.AAC.1